MFAQWLSAQILRLKTRWSRRRLDKQLAQGADPSTSAELRLRAEQLRDRDTRERLARGLAEVLDEALRPQRLTLRLQPHRAEVRASADELLKLGARLREERPRAVQGLARAALLLTRGASPLDPNSGASLRHAVRSAHDALEGPGEPSARQVVQRANISETLAA
jgi:nucleotidyltransferase/DNA polymerase involved in DNA repair